MKTPVISVVVPVYNAGKYFDNCISSIVNQTYKNLEIIIVDDGSTDDTPRACDEWAKKDSRIKVVHKENGGASSARNTGIDNATGDYIGFIDADDYIDADMYEAMLNDILENDADAARCGMVRNFEDGRIENWGGSENKKPYIVDKKKLLCDIGEGVGILPASPCNKLFKKSCIGNTRFDTKYKFAEDTLFNFMVAQSINTMVYHDVFRYHYIFNESSITNKGINENNFDEHRVMDAIMLIAQEDVFPHCVKGDVLKSLKTIRQMILANQYMDRFSAMRKRVLSHRREILKSSLYSKQTKLRVLLLWLSPLGYKFAIKHIRQG